MDIGNSLRFMLLHAGHILGAAMVRRDRHDHDYGDQQDQGVAYVAQSKIDRAARYQQQKHRFAHDRAFAPRQFIRPSCNFASWRSCLTRWTQHRFIIETSIAIRSRLRDKDGNLFRRDERRLSGCHLFLLLRGAPRLLYAGAGQVPSIAEVRLQLVDAGTASWRAAGHEVKSIDVGKVDST